MHECCERRETQKSLAGHSDESSAGRGLRVSPGRGEHLSLRTANGMSRIGRMTDTGVDLRLARDGGPPARTRPEPPMFPGGMEIAAEEIEAATRVLSSKNVFRYYGVGDGPHEVLDFEREFAGHMGAAHALCVNAGSSALICGLIGAGVCAGDEVIVPAYTWNATPNAVIASGATPVLTEVDESLTLDPEDVARKIGPKTKAILPVHMRGAPANMEALTGLAREHGLVLVEDVCQAAGASFAGRRLGTFGDAGAFSLQFNKIITTGEGGVMITSRDDLYELAIDVHDCAGSLRRGAGLPRFAGWNFRASELQGAVARVQLTRLDGLLDRMRSNQRRLADRVEGLPGLTLRRPNDDGGDAGICLIAFADAPVLAADAVEALKAEGVLAMRIYDPAIPDLHIFPYWAPVLEYLKAKGEPAPDCPRTLELLERAIHVDLSPLLEDADVDELALAFEKVARGILA
jgi:8-amino-3,8-dideoxy-alpha-D-manno-octulosonate transaminase